MNVLRQWFHFINDLPIRYQRVVSGIPYNHKLDGIRFLAVSAVIICHVANHTEVYGQFLPKSDHLGWDALYNLFQGVSLLFVLSSFLLSAYLFRIEIIPILKTYYIRRFLRIIPAYWLVISFCAGIHLFYLVDIGLIEGFKHYLIAFSFSNNFVYPDTHPFIMPVGWTVEIELQYYLLLPFFILFYKKFRLTGRIISICLLMPYSMFMGQFDWYVHTSIIYQLPYFAAGILLADWFHHTRFKPDITLISKPVAVVLGILLTGLLLYKNWYYFRVNAVKIELAPILLMLMMWLILSQGFLDRLMRIRWVCFIGNMGYSIYLTHMLVISFAGKWLLYIRVGDDYLINFLIQLILIYPIIIGFGFVFYRFIEHPLMMYGLRKKSDASTPTQSQE